MSNIEPQVNVIRQQNTVTVSASLTVQVEPYTPVSGFRSYTSVIPEGCTYYEQVEIEQKLIETCVAITSLVVDVRLAVNFKQAPRFESAWKTYESYCPDKFKPALGITVIERSKNNTQEEANEIN